MALLILGLVLFLGTHASMIFMAQRRAALVNDGRENAWKLPFTIASLIGLVVMIWGYGQARAVAGFVYDPPFWTSHVTALLMLFALIMFISSRVSGKIAGILKHPQLAAVKTWALAHLIANGDTASVLLFGSFLVWAVVARISLKRRVAAGLASNNPGGPIRNDLIAIVLGLAIYVLFVVWAHEFLFGVAPISR